MRLIPRLPLSLGAGAVYTLAERMSFSAIEEFIGIKLSKVLSIISMPPISQHTDVTSSTLIFRLTDSPSIDLAQALAVSMTAMG